MSANSKGEWTSLHKRLNASGFPFQLAVEKFLRTHGPDYGVRFVAREVAWDEGFLDILVRREHIYFAVECKKVDEESWIFLTVSDERKGRCRLQWYNPRVPDPPVYAGPVSKVFCSEFSTAEPSVESEFAILPKSGPNKILEPLARELVEASRSILDAEDMVHADEQWEVIVPVIVTNAELISCRFQPGQVDLTTGTVALDDTAYSRVPFIRFRKSLVAYHSTPVESSPMDVSSWAADRERTVFIVNAASLDRFLHGFRALSCLDDDGLGNPREWSSIYLR